MTRRDSTRREGGGGDDKGRERSVDDKAREWIVEHSHISFAFVSRSRKFVICDL
jgi:hypothetical protein